MSIEQEMNFLQRQQERNDWEFTEALRYYGDYLQMAEERGMDLTDEIVCRNLNDGQREQLLELLRRVCTREGGKGGQSHV